jgi:hypothetical protein
VERRDDEEEQLVPHLSSPPPETKREISEQNGFAEDGKETRSRRGRGFTVTMARGERQEVRIQHGSHRPRYCFPSQAARANGVVD